jgi:hypothetical protein
LFRWLRKRKQVREDRKYLEARARRLLKSYLSADGPRKQRYYELIAGAAAAWRFDVSDPRLENSQLADNAANAALNVVMMRERQHLDGDEVQSMITDGYAVLAVAHRRAAGGYVSDNQMMNLGLAAVHLVTMSTSYMQKLPQSELT